MKSITILIFFSKIGYKYVINYHICDGLNDFFDDGQELSPFLFKLLCNELSVASFDLSKCKLEDYVLPYFEDGLFEKMCTYKDGKEHVLFIDVERKRYLYDRKKIGYLNYKKENNQFVFDAVFNGIKRCGFQKLVEEK